LLLGPETRNIAGRGWLEERFGGLSYQIGADTFFQVHTQQAERVPPLLQEALGPATGRLVDAYCGIGTFSLPMAQAGWYVHGIEQHTAAVALARRNAVANGLAALTQGGEELGSPEPSRLVEQVAHPELRAQPVRPVAEAAHWDVPRAVPVPDGE
jgi:23S rRNA (uracil1939-C5)-methyltransferase